MPNVTALELVNRVLRRVRDESVANFAGDSALAALEFVNVAKEDVLTSRDWQFDLRQDGVLVTSPTIESVTGGFNQYDTDYGDTDSALDAYETAPLGYVGRLVTRVEYRGDSSVTPSAELVGSVWRVATFQDVITGIRGRLDSEWPGATSSTSSVKYFVAEYLLPDTVREVTSVTNQAGLAVQLMQIDPSSTFEKLFPDPAGRFGSPEWVGVGGYALNTFNPTLFAGTLGAEEGPMLRMVLYPVPDESTRLTYSYYYNHPALVSPTDELEGVPGSVVSDIIAKACADYVQGPEQRVVDGLNMARLAESRLDRRFASHDAQPARRHPVGSWVGGGRGRRSIRNGFPGVTIEE